MSKSNVSKIVLSALVISMLAACSSEEVKDQSMAPVETRSADAEAAAAAEKAAADKASAAELAAQPQGANGQSVSNGSLNDPRLGDGKAGGGKMGGNMGSNNGGRIDSNNAGKMGGQQGRGGQQGGQQVGGPLGGGQQGGQVGQFGDGSQADASATDGKKGAKHLDPRLKDPNNILSKRSVYYDLDKYDVKDEFKPMVEAHAKYLGSNTDANVIVQGNCDERGSREYNVALGHRRAESVRKMMNVLGVSDKQIETVSFGEEKPRAACHEESCWSENRRSDILYQGE